MSNHTVIASATNWLFKTRKNDGGWSLHENPTAPSNLVNTCEAVTALSLAGSDGKQLELSLNFIANEINNSSDSEKDSTYKLVRRYAWALIALSQIRRASDVAAINKCKDWLRCHRLPDGSWPHSSREEVGSTYSTFVATWALRVTESDEVSPKSTYLDWTTSWFYKTQNSDGGWGYLAGKDGQESISTLGGTAYALISLMILFRESPEKHKIQSGITFLLSRLKICNSMTEVEKIATKNHDFIHCTYVWSLVALGHLKHAKIKESSALLGKLIEAQDAEGFWDMDGVREFPTSLALYAICTYTREYASKDDMVDVVLLLAEAENMRAKAEGQFSNTDRLLPANSFNLSFRKQFVACDWTTYRVVIAIMVALMIGLYLAGKWNPALMEGVVMRMPGTRMQVVSLAILAALFLMRGFYQGTQSRIVNALLSAVTLLAFVLALLALL